MADEVPEGSGADSWWIPGGSGGLWRRSAKVLEGSGAESRWGPKVLVQMADEVPEGSGADGQKPARSSKQLGITHEFIFYSPPSPWSLDLWDSFLGSVEHSGNLGVLEGSPEFENGTKKGKNKIEKGRRGKLNFIITNIYIYICSYIYIYIYTFISVEKLSRDPGGHCHQKKRKEKMTLPLHFLKTRTRKSWNQSSGLMGLQSVQKIYIQTYITKALYFHKRGKMGPPFGGFL